MLVRVISKKGGFYGNMFREKGDVFEIKDNLFSFNWMEMVKQENGKIVPLTASEQFAQVAKAMPKNSINKPAWKEWHDNLMRAAKEEESLKADKAEVQLAKAVKGK